MQVQYRIHEWYSSKGKSVASVLHLSPIQLQLAISIMTEVDSEHRGGLFSTNFRSTDAELSKRKLVRSRTQVFPDFVIKQSMLFIH